MSEFVTVANFSNYDEAMVAKASQEANGIVYHMPNRNFLAVEGAGR